MIIESSQHRIRTTAAESAFSLEYNLSQDFSSWNQERHANASFELHIILAGTCRVSVKENLLSLSAGDVLIIPSGIHHMSTSDPGPFSHLSVSFTMAKGNGIFSAVSDFCLIKAGEACRLAARSLMEETASSRPYREEMLALHLGEFFLHVLRSEELSANLTPSPVESAGKSQETDRTRTDLVDVFFEQHHTEPVCEAQLAGMLHVSTRQLSRILKKNYGMNFSEKLLTARMDHAAWLLRTTNLSIAEISAAAGFSSEGNLFRQFKARFGKTPRQYRLR